MSSKYNPWENSRTFIQDVGGLEGLINYINKNGMDNNNNIYQNDPNIGNLYLPINIDNQYKNCNMFIDLLEEMDNLSTIQYQKLYTLEKVYEKYKYSNIMSEEKNNILIDKLNELHEVFILFEKNKIKIANLLHNSSITDSNAIKIKHSKKMDLIKIIKICISDYSSILDLIILSQSMHQETLNKLKNKIKEIEDNAQKLSDEVNHLEEIKND